MSLDPEYLLTTPVEIGSALRELMRSPDRLVVLAEPEPITVQIASVNVREGSFRFRAYSVDDVRRLRSHAIFNFRGSSFGAQIAFQILETREVPDDDAPPGIPTLESPIPTQLFRMQRRQHFRVLTHPASKATWRSARAGGPLPLRIYDVSLGGVGLRCRMPADELPRVGSLLQGVDLVFHELGNVVADLSVVAVYEVVEQDLTLGPIRLTHLGCAFSRDDRVRDRFLERVVRQLEARQASL